MRRGTLRWGLAFIGVTAVAVLLFTIHRLTWDREYTLLDEPMQVIADRTASDAFTIPVHVPYEIDIYVQSRACIPNKKRPLLRAFFQLVEMRRLELLTPYMRTKNTIVQVKRKSREKPC